MITDITSEATAALDPGRPQPRYPRLRVVRCMPERLNEDTDSPRWSYGRMIGPRDDRVAAVLLISGWTLIAAGMWLLGQHFQASDGQANLGVSGWLLIGLLATATALSLRRAVLRLRAVGGDPASLWCVVPRPPDGGRDYAPENRAMRRTMIIGGLLGFALCMSAGLVLGTLGDQFDGGWSRLSAFGFAALVIVPFTIWARRHVSGRIPTAHRVKPVSDPAATAAAVVGSLLSLATFWTAGRVGVPVAVDAWWPSDAASPACTAGVVALAAATFRLQFLARHQARGQAASAIADQTQSPP